MPSTTTGTVFEDPPAQKAATVFDDVPDNLTVNAAQSKPVSYNPLPQIWSDIQSIPSGMWQFLRHPVDATRAAVGEMNLQDPSKSSGLLGLPDVMYERYKAGQRGAAVAPLIEMGLPLAAEMPGVRSMASALPSRLRAGYEAAAAEPISRSTIPGGAGAVVGAEAAKALGLPWYEGMIAGAAAGSKLPAFVRGFRLGEVPAERPVMAPPPVKFKPQEAPPKTYPAPPVNFKTNLTPPPAAGADDFLEGLAQSQTGKSFAKLPAEQQQAVRQLADKIQPPSQQPALTPPPKSEPAPQGRYGDLRQQHGGIYAANAEAKDLAVATYLRQKGITPEQWEQMDLNTQNAHIKATNPSYQPYKVEGSGGRRLGRPAAEGIADISTKLRNLWGK